MTPNHPTGAGCEVLFLICHRILDILPFWSQQQGFSPQKCHRSPPAARCLTGGPQVTCAAEATILRVAQTAAALLKDLGRSDFLAAGGGGGGEFFLADQPKRDGLVLFGVFFGVFG